jgi:cytidine deaminase
MDKILEIRYQEFLRSELSSEDLQLLFLAELAAKDAYAPYSNFKVGAVVVLENGEIIKGSNQENAAYPSGLCAERTTLFYANATYPTTPVTTLAITALNSLNCVVENVITPCGACRQVILEVENRFEKPCKILLASKEKVLVFASVKDLFPFAFGQDALKSGK